MCHLGAEHGVVDVGVGVHVDQSDWAVLTGHGSQDGQHDGVVAAHRRGDHVVGQQVDVVGLDGIHGGPQVEGASCHVAGVVDAEAVERGGPGGHVVGAEQHRLGADVARAEAGARPVGGADVHGDAHHGDVQVSRLGGAGKAHEGGNAAEAGHLVAAEGLGVPCLESLGHRGSIPRVAPVSRLESVVAAGPWQAPHHGPRELPT